MAVEKATTTGVQHLTLDHNSRKDWVDFIKTYFLNNVNIAILTSYFTLGNSNHRPSIMFDFHIRKYIRQTCNTLKLQLKSYLCKIRSRLFLIIGIILFLPIYATAEQFNVNQLKEPNAYKAHQLNAPSIEAAFSPEKGARELVIKAIESAKSEICVLAYIWTSRELTTSLLAAKNRGVVINFVFDQKNNREKETGEFHSSLLRLKSAGINLRASNQFAIMHHKVLLIDGKHLLTGSYNFTQSAASKNAENVLVLWQQKKLVAQYRQEFDNIWQMAEPI